MSFAADMEVLREMETAWLSDQLSRAIANLGYPVGMGIAPHPEQTQSAAKLLFDRYARMVEMVRAASADEAHGAIRGLLSLIDRLTDKDPIIDPAISEALRVLRGEPALSPSQRGGQL